MTNGPVTYAEWVALLERFGNGDNESVELMAAGSFVLDAGTAVRFYARVEEAYKARKKNWQDKFQRSLDNTLIRNADELGIALSNGIKTLRPLQKFVNLPSLPQNIRTTFKDDLDLFVSDTQKSLKDKAVKSYNGRTDLLLVINRFQLSEPVAIAPTQKNNMQDIPSGPSTGGRKIIF